MSRILQHLATRTPFADDGRRTMCIRSMNIDTKHTRVLLHICRIEITIPVVITVYGHCFFCCSAL